MNYYRIYDEFIKDRLEKQNQRGWHKLQRPNRNDPFDKHHIFPRCKGGGDEAANIIKLTIEDHFFAHLLLAKIYGGSLWAPLAFMLGGKRYRPIISRRGYGWLNNIFRKSFSGSDAHQYDWTIYELKNDNGDEWVGTQFEMIQIGISRSLGNMLIKNRIKSAKGWYFKGKKRPKLKTDGGSSHPMYRNKKIIFLHVDGRRFIGTQFNLHKIHGVSKSNASLLARGKCKVANGWYVKGTKLPINGRGAKWKHILDEKIKIKIKNKVNIKTKRW